MTSTGIAAPPETQTSSGEVSVCVGAAVVEHRGVHGRDALEEGHAVALDDLQRLAGVEARDQREHPPTAIVALSAQVWPKAWKNGSAPA